MYSSGKENSLEVVEAKEVIEQDEEGGVETSGRESWGARKRFSDLSD